MHPSIVRAVIADARAQRVKAERVGYLQHWIKQNPGLAALTEEVEEQTQHESRGACTLCGRVAPTNDANECEECAADWCDDDSDSAAHDPGHTAHDH